MFFRETEAIVLRTDDYGESDRLVTFYTRWGGRLKGIAKGARRSRKRFVHAFEPESLVELTYRERKNLIWIEGCKLLEPHLALRTDVQRWAYAALVSEIVGELTPEAEPQEELFVLFKETLARLTSRKDSRNIVVLFFIKFLSYMGYLPALEACSVCRRPAAKGTRWVWQMHEGRMICPDHHSPPNSGFLLDLGTLRLVQQVRRLPVERIWRLHVRRDRQQLFLEALLGWARSQISKDLKSVKILKQVQSPLVKDAPVKNHGTDARPVGESIP